MNTRLEYSIPSIFIWMLNSDVSVVTINCVTTLLFIAPFHLFPSSVADENHLNRIRLLYSAHWSCAWFGIQIETHPSSIEKSIKSVSKRRYETLTNPYYLLREMMQDAWVHLFVALFIVAIFTTTLRTHSLSKQFFFIDWFHCASSLNTVFLSIHSWLHQKNFIHPTVKWSACFSCWQTVNSNWRTCLIVS